MITFVVFHMQPLNEATSIEKASASINKRREVDYNRLIAMLFCSAELFHPNCRKVVLTDLETTFTLPLSVELKRSELDPSQMMFSRLWAQLDFVRAFDFRV